MKEITQSAKSEKEFEAWVSERERELFNLEKFAEMGKQDDFIFQALAFMGNASFQMSLANTVVQDVEEVPSKLKAEMKQVNRLIQELQEKLREIN